MSLLLPATAVAIGTTGFLVAEPAEAPPTVTITRPPPATTTDVLATVTFTTTGQVDAINCDLDGVAIMPCTSPLLLTALPVGDHILQVQVANTAGTAVATANWTVTAPQPPAGPVFAGHRTAQGWEPSFPNISIQAGRYRFVILHGAFADIARELKAADPDVKVLLYKNVSQSIDTEIPLADTMLSTGVQYEDADSNHPDWFLLNAAGERITRHYTAAETDYLMDVGNTAYAETWAQNVTALAKRDGWDGIFADDTLPTLQWWLASQNPAEVVLYPSDAAWQGATRTFLSSVGSALHAEGLLLIPNICCQTTFSAVRNEWLQFVDGTMDEGFLNPTTGSMDQLAYSSGPGAWNSWETYLQEIIDAEAGSKYLLTMTHGTGGDDARARYALGTYLLAANGLTSFEYHASDTLETWIEDYDLAATLGPPSGPHQRLENGLYRRDFSDGVVVVNPGQPGSEPLTIALGGTYSGGGLADITSATLDPGTAAILRRS